MFIHEAVKKAMESNKCIAREEVWKFEGENSYPIRIKPSNTYGNCFLNSENKDGSTRRCQNWNPTADDLMAGDWIVVDQSHPFISLAQE